MIIELKGRLGAVTAESGRFTADVSIEQPSSVVGCATHHLGRLGVELSREQGLELLGRDPWAGDVRVALTIEVPAGTRRG
jgi:hypothetical protein